MRIAFVLSLLALAPMLMAANDLEVLEQGRYACALPGDATGPAWNPNDEHAFTVTLGSSYSSAAGKGTYLLTRELLIFTRGPFRNERFRRGESGLLRQIDDNGKPGRLSCNRIGPAI